MPHDPFDSLSLAGQHVVIVGGTSGMGLGAARAAAAAGARVTVAGRRKPPTGVSDDTPRTRFAHRAVDLTSADTVRALFEDVGELDHLFITATPKAPVSDFSKQSVEDAQHFMNGKFFGSWQCAKCAAPHLRASGSITFLTGATSVRPQRGMAIVTATFAALEALSQALALDLSPIRVNTIRPGLIDSAMWDFLDDHARASLRERVRSTFPVQRIGTIDDIGHAAVFLMTNGYVTGTVLEVSGGETLVKLDLKDL